MTYKIASYARKSLKEMSGEYSIAAQQKMISDWASRHEGYEIVAEFVDGVVEDGSGGDATRKEYSEMKAAAKRGFFDGVAIWKVDRVARDVKEFLITLDDLKDNFNVNMHVVTFPDSLDIYSTEGRTFVQMNVVFAEHERRIVGDRIRMGLKQKRAGGEWTGQAPYGWRVMSEKEIVGTKVKSYNTRLIPVPDEQQIRSRVLEMVVEGMFPTEIARKLTDEAVKTRRGKTRWASSTVRSIINLDTERISRFLGEEEE